MDKKYYLDFTFGRVEILEPIGYDGSNTMLKQSDNRYARDVMYGSDKVKLKFQDEYGEPCEPYILDNGVIVKHLGSGFNLLLEENRNFGSESDVKFIVSDGVEEFSMSLNFADAETDDFSFIELSLIQEDTLAVYKRQEKKPIDLFSDKDLEGNTITPVQTLKVLFKAQPVTQVSQWGQSRRQFAVDSPTNMVALGAGFNNYNPCQAVQSYGIEDTLSNFDTSFSFANVPQKARFVRASNSLTKLRLTVETDITHHHRFNNIPDPFGNPSRSEFKIRIGRSTDGISLRESQTVYNNIIEQDYAVNFKIPELIEIDVDFSLNQGEYFLIWFQSPATIRATSVDYNNTAISSFLTFNKCDFTLKAISTGVSSVTNAVRYIDAIKQINKAIGTLPTVTPRFEIGGQWYNNVLFNGKLIRQITDEPFTISLEDLRKNLSGEFNSDYQVSNDEFFVGHESEFYTNEDLGGFLNLPDTDFGKPKNDRFLINEFNFIYENYEKDKDEKNTLDAIHTEFKTSVPQKKSENTREVKCNFARDPYYGETIRRRNTLSSTTAYDSDDKVIMYDIIELAPNSRGNINFILTYEAVAGVSLKILANSTFRWDLLGFKVGDSVILTGDITSTRTVLEITPSILTLSHTTGTLTETRRLKLDYPLTDVAYTIRTSEGLTYADNLLNSEDFGNLRYSIKRNIFNNYSEYLASTLLFTSSKEILKTEFKANGEATTQFTGEDLPITEQEDFTVDLSKKILTQNLIETTVYCDFSTAKNLLDNIQNQKGFIRVIDNNERVLKGYVKEFDRNDKANELNLLLEEKFESDFLVITFDGTNFVLNETGYEPETVIERRYNIYNDKIQFFDKNNLILCNRTHYSKVQYNGIVYNSAIELVTALENG